MTGPPQDAGNKCRVCSMPFAAGLTACPSCAYDRRAAAEAEARTEPDPSHGRGRRWGRRPRG